MSSGDSTRLSSLSSSSPSGHSSSSPSGGSGNITRGAAFVDAETERAVDWSHLLAIFAPITPYGRDRKRTLQPFLPGFEADAKAVWNQIREDDRHWKDEDLGRLREALSRLPDIREAIETVAWSSAPLTPKHFLALKQFVVRGARLSESPEVQGVGWSEPARWRRLLQVFAAQPAEAGRANQSAQADDWPAPIFEAATDSRPRPTARPNQPAPTFEVESARMSGAAEAVSDEVVADEVVSDEVIADEAVSEQFSIADLATPAYEAAAAAMNSALHKVAQAKHRQQITWRAIPGANLRRDGQLVITLPAHRDLAEACKQDACLKWLRDTPFESIFEVVPTAELQAAEAELEEAKATLSREEDIILGILTERLRETLPLWNQAAEDTADLDVRIAKVRMLHQFDGCIPEFTDALHVVDAVHPETADRLRKQSQTFTHITLRPEDGVNILFGSNMGGKTLSLSMLAAYQMLAQFGLPVPAKAFHTRLFFAIRFAATTGTDVHSGLSAYGSEVVRVSDCWRALVSASPALIVFDEPVRSTNPIEGAALVTGLVRAARRQTEGTLSVVWIATHFADPLSEPGITKFRVRGLQHHSWSALTDPKDRVESLKRLEAAMDYQIDRVDTTHIDQEALPVAEILGAPKEWLEHAKAYLQEGKS
ncbi:MutS-related protein [Alicyclobacillus ferrooxydans]|uniref:DNA mismatch repair proteins mutS family domain-containing protein n=1 Tax=Alicyclobacillus ferrooxydans TaxID=471514 RepID=A0A0P9CBH4_9BACL|nr:hypothetical protein [Alicyclobacillus ferrooxydans]KPV42777.1 hypothetical protein AN477_15640 [Alicyclobacillus ferrooxydans]